MEVLTVRDSVISCGDQDRDKLRQVQIWQPARMIFVHQGLRLDYQNMGFSSQICMPSWDSDGCQGIGDRTVARKTSSIENGRVARLSNDRRRQLSTSPCCAGPPGIGFLLLMWKLEDQGVNSGSL
ncbi:hypothetical protein NPIL_17391 [Nephila pilipes]|uniref:Uncharacterized protein n=1 Tax=Nephila pilipes TaxID=299642 RepID=A0A8X6MXR5_NEPPI|nr:hypothetical protein NPIL_17391 [Nephila pilipes]